MACRALTNRIGSPGYEYTLPMIQDVRLLLVSTAR
jgi:hypothetical protein